jgi:hypothetical protein
VHMGVTEVMAGFAQDAQPRKIRRWKGPEGRPARLVVEALPDDPRVKYHQDRFIVESFVASLAHFHGRKVTVLGEGEEPSDVDAEENGATFGIQLKEVRAKADGRKRQLQRQYVDSIRRELGSLATKLDGLQITFLGGPGANIPALYVDGRGEKGRELVRTIAAEMRALAGELEALPLNDGLSSERTSDPTQAIQGFIAWRFASQGSRSWRWVFPPHPKQVAETVAFLAERVDTYTHKYTQPLWLLLWEVSDGVGVYREEAAEQVRAVLRSRHHPFTEIWHCIPDGKGRVGSVYQIWPANK